VRPPAGVPQVRDYLHLLVDGWIVIVLTTVLSVGAGWAAWETRDPVYGSTARVFVVAPGGATPMDAYYGGLRAVSRTVTYRQLATSAQVAARSIDQLGLQQTPQEFRERVTVGATNSALLEISVTGHHPELTRDTANVLTANLIQVSREMAAVDTAATELVLVDQASQPYRLGSMRQYFVWGGVIGLALSAVLVLAHGALRGTLLGKRQVGRVVDAARRRRG
jgi:capsular polysaccharide biosynthesis protein